MKLEIPLEIQKKDSLDCGLISLLMIFKYFGINKSFKEIQEELKVDEIGTYSPQMGTFMIKNGFDAEIITQHPGLFTIKDRNKSQEEILYHIKKLLQQEDKEQNKKVLNHFIEFLKYGGKITIKIPEIEDIQKSIKEKSPLIALLTTIFATGKKPKFNFHFNVITGIDEKYVYVNDPLPDQRGGKKKYQINDFLFGLYASSYGDLDNGSLLKISKK